MKRRYFYTRVTRRGLCPDGQVEIVAGVEVLRAELATDVYERTKKALAGVDKDQLWHYCDQALADRSEMLLKEAFGDLGEPGRSYFLEIGRGDNDEYVQVFHP